MQLAHFDIRITAIDHSTDKRRWNGRPLASDEASNAINDAVEEAKAVLREHGFGIINTGYGVHATETED